MRFNNLPKMATVRKTARHNTPATHQKMATVRKTARHNIPATHHHQSSSSSPPLPPLCERPPLHPTSLSDFISWQHHASQSIQLIGDSWIHQHEDSPSQQDLQTELKWLIEDATTTASTTTDNTKSSSSSSSLLLLRAPLPHLQDLWTRRLTNRTPLQYLTNTAHWRDFIFSVGPGVLIPRPETELIIDYCKEALLDNDNNDNNNNSSSSSNSSNNLPWLDLGTGSGALAISLAKYFPSSRISRIYAIDKSSAAAAYARYNAERLLVEEGEKGRVVVLEGSWFEPLDDMKLDSNNNTNHLGGGGGEGDHSSSSSSSSLQLGGIVSNPPYIPQSILTQGLQEEVERHEPRLALDGGGGLGVDSLEEICRGARRYLVPGGFIALETNGGEQAEYVAQVLLGGGGGGEEGGDFEEVRVRKDLRGVGRFVTARRKKKKKKE